MEKHVSEFKKVVRTLNKYKVDFLLIGGYAVVFHGFTRTTSDIDFWFKPSDENYLKLLRAIEEYGVNIAQLQNEVFHPENTFLRFKTNGIKIEFLSSIPGSFTYREASEASVKTKVYGSNVKVIHIDHLIENKTVLNRPVDKLDVEELKKRKNPQ